MAEWRKEMRLEKNMAIISRTVAGEGVLAVMHIWNYESTAHTIYLKEEPVTVMCSNVGLRLKLPLGMCRTD